MNKKTILSTIWISLIYITILFLVIFFNIAYNNKMENNVSSFEYYGWIVVESLGMAVVLLLFIISLFVINYDIENWKEKIIYSIITLNIVWLIYILLKVKKKGLLILRFKKWKIIDYTLIAMSICIYMVLAVICKMLIPTIPQLFISLSLEYIALFFIAYITQSFLKTILTSFICGMMLMVLPTTYFISFPQFLFDYLIPNMGVSIAGLFIFNSKNNKSIFKWLSFITIPYIIVYFSRVLAGVIFYGEFAWDGFPLTLYSMIINGLNTFVDYGVMVVVGPLILSRMWPIKVKYKTKLDN